MRFPKIIGVATGLVLLSSLVACGTPEVSWTFQRELLAADRLADYGEYEEARAAYRELAWTARRQDLLSYLRFREALMLELQGDLEGALSEYEVIYRYPRSLYDYEAADALYRSALILRDQYGDREQATRLLQALVQTFPNSTAAEDALSTLIRQWRRQGETATMMQFLAESFQPLHRTEIADNLLYWLGRITQEELADHEGAIEYYRVITHAFQPSPLADDALWRTALAYRSMGRIDEEYSELRAFFGAREVTWFMAEYESDFYKPSLERMTEIHADREEWAQAIEILRLYQQSYRRSLLLDEIHVRIMEFQYRLGDLAGMEAELADLREAFPESRKVARAEELLARARRGEAP